MEVEMGESQAPLSPPAPPEALAQAEAEVQSPKTSNMDQSCQTDRPGSQDKGTPPSGNPSPGHPSPGCCQEPGDPALLQQQISTSKSGIQQIIECFRSGTAQLRHMLLRDVDTIFECKICRSLFRGLPNLITHREYYCQPHQPETDGPPEDSKQGVAMKELLEAIYPRKDPPAFVLHLEPIQTSSKAVFQYLSTEEELAQQGPPGAPHQQYTPRSSRCHSPEPWAGEAEAEGVGEAEGVETGHSPKRGGEEEGEETGGEKTGGERGEKGAQAEEEGSTSGVEDVTISCCLCGQDFNSRRSIRRHCRKMHQTKLEELRKFTETRTVPTSLLSMVKGRSPRTVSTPSGKSCPICYKSFATKANVRRHFDEVHRGLRRDIITPEIATRPGQLLSLETTPPRRSSSSSSPTRGHTPKTTPLSGKTSAKTPPPVQTPPPAPQALYSLASCRCLVCKRKYVSQVMLKRHMRIVHKIYNLRNGGPLLPPAPPAPATPNNSGVHSPPSSRVQVKKETSDASDDPDSSPAPSPGPSNSLPLPGGVTTPTKTAKVKEEAKGSGAGGSPPKSATSQTSGSSPSSKTPKLSVGFDFKQLFCKLCKRQFSSRQNLTKHIELHTDGNDIFIKFYRCPLCGYESRRKRDVLRHVTVVHKKSTTYLAKIMPKLENRAVKRPAEAVLNATPASKRSSAVKEEVNGSHSPPPPPLSPPVTRKQDHHAPTAPLTRRSERQETPVVSPPTTRRQEALQESAASSEVRVTKNFSLHACDVCGRAFAKKLYLESHKRSHRNAAAAAAAATPENRRKGVSTRSKALL